jgi:alkanesulfonate monooxygenase SsuD/methylene tetrahydromethanopterin reductase-like flavin-dependent oxidoreductase (luciferase family)
VTQLIASTGTPPDIVAGSWSKMPAMATSFGLMVTNQHPPHESTADRWRETVDQVRLARDLGFDLVLLGQHFLATEFQMLQPTVAAARLAGETGSMRIGVTIYLLPLLNPVQLAEDAASLDVVTGGRFIFGIGLGYRKVEDDAFGLLPGARVSRARAHLDVVTKLWAGEPVDYESPSCTLRGATTLVRPVQKPRPAIWVAANNDRAVMRAAEIGDTWIVNPHATMATIARQVDLFRATCARIGRPAPAEIPVIRELCIGETRSEALRVTRPHLERKYQAYVAWGQHKVLPGDDDMTQTFDGLARDRFIIGDPGECAAEIQRTVARTGATAMIFRLHWPGMPHDAVMRGLRLLGEKVRPLVG